jgi:hypothetical protein
LRREEAVTIHFCTLFDARYAARGLVMLESLEQHFKGDKSVTILAMDEATPSIIDRLGRADWKVVSTEQLGDADLLDVSKTRPHREFCWTCTPALINQIVKSSKEGEVVVYLDADLYFFASPQIILEELGQSGNILIHEHRFSADRRDFESSSGRFNVGLVAFVASDEARACINRWRRQVLDKCVMDPDRGFCGDQGYLNEWPDRYAGLRVLRNIGAGVAPWNLLSYNVSGSKRRPVVDGVPVIFFHYHSLRTISADHFGYVAILPAWGYEFSRESQRLLFVHYPKKLRQIFKRAARFDIKFSTDLERPLGEVIDAVLRQQLVPLTWYLRRAVSYRRNKILLVGSLKRAAIAVLPPQIIDLLRRIVRSRPLGSRSEVADSIEPASQERKP